MKFIFRPVVKFFSLALLPFLRILLVILAIVFLPGYTRAESDIVTLYIPQVHAAYCISNAQEQALADLLRNDPQQQRATINCNPALSRVASAMALDMATRDYFDTVNPEGNGPNYLVTQAGYILPDYYSQSRDANHIASIAGGLGTADQMWTNQAESAHLRGASQFYVRQTEFGVGYAYNPKSKFKHYWVTLIAQPGP